MIIYQKTQIYLRNAAHIFAFIYIFENLYYSYKLITLLKLIFLQLMLEGLTFDLQILGRPTDISLIGPHIVAD